MSVNNPLPVERFLQTLHLVSREGKHLLYSHGRLYSQSVDVAWVQGLDNQPELAERLEAFISRFGRMQDTIADKLLPRWLLALAEMPGSQIETLNRAERLGVVSNVESWLEHASYATVWYMSTWKTQKPLPKTSCWQGNTVSCCWTRSTACTILPRNVWR